MTTVTLSEVGIALCILGGTRENTLTLLRAKKRELHALQESIHDLEDSLHKQTVIIDSLIEKAEEL